MRKIIFLLLLIFSLAVACKDEPIELIIHKTPLVAKNFVYKKDAPVYYAPAFIIDNTSSLTIYGSDFVIQNIPHKN